uniref:Uncharacterized protein n=1 Tax=Picea glauca TaxID=3330 RepID=A0A117NHN1_PICGL|nr:hypothetical protein ABT39_MTgene4651 [Picea glauca]KUM51350.1 hypothetical protein ABT39_MTgene1197 [Picea glauca]QHR86728.1 hypothetical protein Q903MT_gene732 [Picea sitchensis]
MYSVGARLSSGLSINISIWASITPFLDCPSLTSMKETTALGGAQRTIQRKSPFTSSLEHQYMKQSPYRQRNILPIVQRFLISFLSFSKLEILYPRSKHRSCMNRKANFP